MPVTKLLVDVGDGQAEQLVEDASTTVSQRSHCIYKSLFVLCQHHQQALLKNWGRFLPASIRKAHFFEARELFRMARQGLRCALQIGMPFQVPICISAREVFSRIRLVPVAYMSLHAKQSVAKLFCGPGRFRLDRPLREESFSDLWGLSEEEHPHKR